MKIATDTVMELTNEHKKHLILNIANKFRKQNFVGGLVFT